MEQPELTSKYESLYLENQLCFPLYACAKEIVRQYRKPLSGLDLTYTQYIAMMVLWEFGDMTEGELGKKLHLDSGTLAPLLKRLEKQGLLERNRLAGNERKLFLSLSPQGRAMREQALEVPRAMQGCLDLPEEELMELKRLLEKALASMEGRSN